MVRECNIFKIWICAVFICSAYFVLPGIVDALEPMGDNELLQNSPALKTEMRQKPAPAQPGQISGQKQPGRKDSKRPQKSLPGKTAETADKSDSIGDAGPEKFVGQKFYGISEEIFYNSVCFKCHGINDIHPETQTQKQWRLLIEENGHAVIEPIPWSSPAEKQEIMDYLLNRAKDTLPESEGIGVW